MLVCCLLNITNYDCEAKGHNCVLRKNAEAANLLASWKALYSSCLAAHVWNSENWTKSQLNFVLTPLLYSAWWMHGRCCPSVPLWKPGACHCPPHSTLPCFSRIIGLLGGWPSLCMFDWVGWWDGVLIVLDCLGSRLKCLVLVKQFSCTGCPLVRMALFSQHSNLLLVLNPELLLLPRSF